MVEITAATHLWEFGIQAGLSAGLEPEESSSGNRIRSGKQPGAKMVDS